MNTHRHQRIALALCMAAAGCKQDHAEVASDTATLASDGGTRNETHSDAGRSTTLATRGDGAAAEDLEPCSPDLPVPEPVLKMPLSRIVESYLTPGAALPTFGVDYLVSPGAQVNALLVEFDFDLTQLTTPRELKTTCPAAITAALLTPNPVVNEVIAVHVTASGERTERRGDLFYSVGQASITVDMSSIVLDPQQSWYAVYEPAWGTERALVVPVPSDARTSLTIDHVPEGPGLLGIVAADELRVDPESGILEAPAGYAAAWPERSLGWFSALWLDHPKTAIKLTQLSSAGTVLNATSSEDAELTTEAPMLVLLGPRPESLVVSAPCGRVAVSVPSFARVDIGFDANVLTLNAGQSGTAQVECAPGEQQGTLAIRARGLNGRTARVVLTMMEQAR